MDDEQLENSKVPKQLRAHVYKKGQCGNPDGRPKGSVSLKTYAKAMLEKMDDEQREEFFHGLPKQFIWEMAEGKAESKTDVTTNGKELPQPILMHVYSDNSTSEATTTKEED